MSEAPVPQSAEELIAPVIYELGKALYIAQMFETSLLFLVALLSHQDGQVNKESFVEGLSHHAERTLGQLTKAFHEKLSLPDNFHPFMREGVNIRNSIAHGFVMRNTIKFRTEVGRASMISELKDAQYELEQRRLFADSTLHKCLQVFGGNLDQLRGNAEAELYADQLTRVTRH